MKQQGSLPQEVKSRLRVNVLAFIVGIGALIVIPRLDLNTTVSVVLIAVIFIGIIALNLWQLAQVVRRSRGSGGNQEFG